MAGEQTAPEAPTVEDRLADKLWGAEEPEEVQASDDQVEDQAEDAEEVEEPQSETVEEVEVEVENWRGKIPAKLKAELDKAQDYTKKTQALAEEKRVFEAQLRVEQERQQFTQAVSQELQQLRDIEAKLAQYESINVSEYDAESLAKMSFAANQLAKERMKLQESIQAKHGQFKQTAEKAWDEMAVKAAEVVKREIPTWDSDAPKMAEWALQQGISYEALSGYNPQTKERVGPGLVDPAHARILHMAWKWSQLQAQKASTTQKVKGAPPMLKPGAVDPRSNKQIEHMNFRKAIKNAKSDGQKAELIGERLSKKFNF